MKKIILPLVAAALLTACGNNTDDGQTSQNVTDNTTVQQEELVRLQEAHKVEIPEFSDASVNENLQEINHLMAALTQAVTEKDPQKISDLGVRFGVWAKEAHTWVNKLKPEERQKYSDFMTKMHEEYSARIQEAVQASAPGAKPNN